MRSHGLADSPGAIGLNGHACWGYADAGTDFMAAAVEFLVEGISLGQRLMFVGGPEAESAVRELEPTRSMVADGSLQVAPFEAIYPSGRRMPNAEQWAAYSQATDQALADGFTGLRVLAEVTSLASPGGAWRSHALWESYADRLMANRPLAALCCFDRQALQAEALGAIASAHPVADVRLGSIVPFRLYGASDGLCVTGEVDAFSASTLEELLGASDGSGADEVLDLGGVSFIDHHGVLAIQRHATRLREQGGRLTLRAEPLVFSRLSDLLGVAW